MSRPDPVRVLREEIENDLAALPEARSSLAGAPSRKDLAYVGFLLHRVYTGWESAFHRIAVTFENRLDPARWHADLLLRMTLDVSGVRPAVIDPVVREHLEELRSFRHFFLHSYSSELRAHRLALVLEALDAAVPCVTAHLTAFCEYLARLAEDSEDR